MIKKSTIVLFVITLLIFIFIIFFERKQKSTTEKMKEKNLIFSSLQGELLSLEREGLEDFLIVKKDVNYYLEEPVKDITETASVDSFFKSLKEAQAKRLLNEGVNLKDLGLENPVFTIKIKTDRGDYKLEIGKGPPLEKGVYFRGGEKIGVLDELTLETLKRGIKDFRNKDLCAPYESQNIKRVEYRKEGKKLLEVSLKSQKWYVKYPYEDLADERKVFFLIEDLIFWPVMDFFGEGEEKVFSDKIDSKQPIEEFRLETLDGKEIKIELLKEKEDNENFYYSRVNIRPGVIILSRKSIRVFENLDDYRSMKIFEMEPDKCDEIVLIREKIIMIKREKGIFISPNLKEDQVKTFVYSLLDLEGEKKFEGKVEEKFMEIELSRGHDKEKVIFFRDKDNLIAFPLKRNLYIVLSKEKSDKLIAEVKTLFMQNEN